MYITSILKYAFYSLIISLPTAMYFERIINKTEDYGVSFSTASLFAVSLFVIAAGVLGYQVEKRKGQKEQENPIKQILKILAVLGIAVIIFILIVVSTLGG
jgi:uncharacterized membrane protein YidH (DUF202 family)